MLSNAVNSKENLKIKTFEIVSLLYCIFDINCPLIPEHDFSIFNKHFPGRGFILLNNYKIAQGIPVNHSKGYYYLLQDFLFFFCFLKIIPQHILVCAAGRDNCVPSRHHRARGEVAESAGEPKDIQCLQFGGANKKVNHKTFHFG